MNKDIVQFLNIDQIAQTLNEYVCQIPKVNQIIVSYMDFNINNNLSVNVNHSVDDALQPLAVVKTNIAELIDEPNELFFYYLQQLMRHATLSNFLKTPHVCCKQ